MRNIIFIAAGLGLLVYGCSVAFGAPAQQAMIDFANHYFINPVEWPELAQFCAGK